MSNQWSFSTLDQDEFGVRTPTELVWDLHGRNIRAVISQSSCFRITLQSFLIEYKKGQNFIQINLMTQAVDGHRPHATLPLCSGLALGHLNFGNKINLTPNSLFGYNGKPSDSHHTTTIQTNVTAFTSLITCNRILLLQRSPQPLWVYVWLQYIL